MPDREHYCWKCEEGNDLETPVKIKGRWVHPSCLLPAPPEIDPLYAAQYAYACGYRD